MYGTGEKLLSGIPIHELGTIKRDDIKAKHAEAVQKRAGKPIEIMPFGKYKGERIAVIPEGYKKWMLNEFDWHAGNENLRQSILMTMNKNEN
jgi:DNA repair protein RadD